MQEAEVLSSMLYSLRLKAGLKQVELARMLNVPQSFVSKIENGQRRVDLIELSEICRIFGLGLTEFIQQFEENLNAAKSQICK